jgi:hypothetical protein
MSVKIDSKINTTGWSIPDKLLGKRLCKKSQRFGKIRQSGDTFTGYGSRPFDDSYCGTPLTKVKSKYKTEGFEAETKLSKTSCCCGADEANPCVCMKAPEPMECSAKAPKCACYKALEKNAEFLYYYVLNEKGESPADFNTLEEAQTYVANSSEPLEIYERRSRDDEAYKMDKKMNAEYDEEDMVFCNHCSDIVGNEKEVYGDETVEYEMANGELVCIPCHKIWMKEYKNDLDPHYSPFYAESFIKSHYVWGVGIFALTLGLLSRKR